MVAVVKGIFRACPCGSRYPLQVLLPTLVRAFRFYRSRASAVPDDPIIMTDRLGSMLHESRGPDMSFAIGQ